MNEQLKTLNKKILLLNKVLQLNYLFNQDYSRRWEQSKAEELLIDIVKKSRKHIRGHHEIGDFTTMLKLVKVASGLRTIFGNKTVVLKRKIVNDKLVSISMQDVANGDTIQLNTDAFEKSVENINV